MNVTKCVLLCYLTCFLTACDETSHFAPVTEIGSQDPIPKTGLHRVSHGETLYEIAWRYGLDYRTLAVRNHMTSPYVLYTGQIVKLKTDEATLLARKQQTNTLSEIEEINDININKNPSYAWIMPTEGKIVRSFTMTHKGINIEGSLGEPIKATADGKVVYSGNGLHGYGNLIILKHNSLYLSAYAHNRTILVKEGDEVRQGQKIAEMGNTGADRIMLHFEIRRAGKPIDPTTLIR